MRHARQPGTRAASERGAATAELALGLPLLLAVTLLSVWTVQVVVQQVRVVDAAREAARAVARGDPEPEAVRLARAVAPERSTVEVTLTEGRVVVRVRARVSPWSGLLGGATEVGVESSATALVETPTATGVP